MLTSPAVGFNNHINVLWLRLPSIGTAQIVTVNIVKLVSLVPPHRDSLGIWFLIGLIWPSVRLDCFHTAWYKAEQITRPVGPVWVGVAQKNLRPGRNKAQGRRKPLPSVVNQAKPGIYPNSSRASEGKRGGLHVSLLLTPDADAFLWITATKWFCMHTLKMHKIWQCHQGAVLTVQGCSALPQPPWHTAVISVGTEADQMSLLAWTWWQTAPTHWTPGTPETDRERE